MFLNNYTPQYFHFLGNCVDGRITVTMPAPHSVMKLIPAQYVLCCFSFPSILNLSGSLIDFNSFSVLHVTCSMQAKATTTTSVSAIICHGSYQRNYCTYRLSLYGKTYTISDHPHVIMCSNIAFSSGMISIIPCAWVS